MASKPILGEYTGKVETKPLYYSSMEHNMVDGGLKILTDIDRGFSKESGLLKDLKDIAMNIALATTGQFDDLKIENIVSHNTNATRDAILNATSRMGGYASSLRNDIEGIGMPGTDRPTTLAKRVINNMMQEALEYRKEAQKGASR